ncbi:hypothetical protein Ae201684P_011027 [Aphanomyces euteiches]|uniref:Anaphase-promoting complex subunit 4 WD40 domain-containing protein n=1 Tax=Aphanomyces euteiches TaxID=100861 RepID=A0A6G0XW38_9STRA|nr:hypothetical protein Ae201684_000519 [Aphanomyces euteiches]KAH9091482.1 hypothetical protein Ae201684P_011027 [Aphanomyces euteiches]KAH9140346.1 hypothetical protein AeRB84_015388 [Aphanomyces euteiches]
MSSIMMPLFDERPARVRPCTLSNPTYSCRLGAVRPRSSLLPNSSAISTNGLAYGVDVSEEHAFVACINNVTLINLRDKTMKARCPVPGTTRALAATPSGKAVYVACQNGGLNVLSRVGNDLQHVDHFNVMAVGIAMTNTVAVVACEQTGLCFFDSRSHKWLSMLPLQYLGTTLRAKAVAVHGNRYAYVACDAGVVAVVDFHDPRHPVLHATKKVFAGEAHAVALSEKGNSLFVACGAKGIAVVNLLGFKAMGHVRSAYGAVFDLHVVGSLLLTACQMGGLAVFCVGEDRMRLTLLGQTNAFDGISHGIRSVNADRGLEAVVTCQSGGVQLVPLDSMAQWPGPKKAGFSDACSIM